MPQLKQRPKVQVASHSEFCTVMSRTVVEVQASEEADGRKAAAQDNNPRLARLLLRLGQGLRRLRVPTRQPDKPNGAYTCGPFSSLHPKLTSL